MIHIVVTLVFSLLIYLTGNLVSSIFHTEDRIKTFANIFLKYAIGTLILLITYALIITSFKTIYSIASIVIILYLFLSNARIQSITDISASFVQGLKMEFKGLLILQIGLILFITFQYFSTGYLMGIKYNAINEDISYYITLAEYLNHTGIENNNTFYNDFLKRPISGIAPYHYFDLYISGFLFFSVSFINNMEIYNFVFLPFCYFLVFISFVSLFENYLKSKTGLLITLSLTFTFFVGYFPASAIGIKGVEFLGGFGIAPFKYIPSYVFLSLLWLFYQNKRNHQIALLIALLPTFSILYLFFIPVLFLFLFFLIHLDSKGNNFSAYKPLLTPILSIFGIGLLYISFGENASQLLSGKRSNSIVNTIDYSTAKTILIYGLFTSAAFFIPLYLIIAYTIRQQILFVKKHFIVISAYIGIILWGLLGHAFYQTNAESWQLGDIFFMPTMKIGLGIMVAFSISQIKKNTFNRILLLLPISFIIIVSLKFHYNNIDSNKFSYAFSNSFIADLQPYSNAFAQPGVALIDTVGFGSNPLKAKPYLVTYAGFSKFISKKSAVFSISIPEQKDLENLKSIRVAKSINNSPFGQYISEIDDSITYQQSQRNFIIKHRIPYILAHEKIKLNDALKPLISREFHDTKTKQKVYILHY